MPLITNRAQVLELYAEAEQHKWVLPTFNSENLTTSEAILHAVADMGQAKGKPDLPVIIGITCQYPDRPQAQYYAHCRRWDLGLRLFLADLGVLTAKDSPFARLRVMVHLDHIQWDLDKELLTWGMDQFSSIMYDASSLSLEENIQKTAEYVNQFGSKVLIEGALDEIGDGSTTSRGGHNAAMAEEYLHRTGVDLIVANLGTEHRASVARLNYNRELARAITRKIGAKLCLHGTSSVAKENLLGLFDDGIRKVNLWTALERESSYVLFKDMLQNASKIVGPDATAVLTSLNLLGTSADQHSQLSSAYATTTYRQQIIFEEMNKIVTEYLKIWYR